MIDVVFSYRGGAPVGFKVSGHSGLSAEGSDIVCAAVSAMTMLAVNTLESRLSNGKSSVDRSDNAITYEADFPDGFSEALLETLRGELEQIQNDYPANIRVREERTQNKSERNNGNA